MEFKRINNKFYLHLSLLIAGFLMFSSSQIIGQNDTAKTEIYKPLNSFLKHHINELIVEVKWINGTIKKEVVLYKRENNSNFVRCESDGDALGSPLESNFDVNLLQSILNNINQNPFNVSQLNDFQIDNNDIQNYFRFIDEKSEILDVKKRDFLISVASLLSSIKSSEIVNILAPKPARMNCAVALLTNVSVVNNNNDTLFLSKKYCQEEIESIREFYNKDKEIVWLLPWKIEYNNLSFYIHNLDLTEFVNACIPDSFEYKEEIDKTELIKKIAVNLWHSQNKR
ncbi:MAG: hypothetical protein GX140_00715 [Bacteroidales bacterium]|jgi:hypothetical protein|nr:hypothetical protein [Bacteroidales bacterium]